MPRVPDTGPGKRVIGAGARTDGREASRQTSEVGAVCRKAARRIWCSEASCHSSGCKSRQHKESSPCCSDTQRQGG